MKPTVTLVTVWLTVGCWCLNCCMPSSVAELVSIDMVNSARCHVRCLSFTQGYRESDVRTADLLAVCRQDDGCSDCARPCTVAVQSPSSCEQRCLHSADASVDSEGAGGASCRDSCRFLRRVNTIRPGTCPPETTATGYEARCVNSCDNDADCDSARRRRPADSSAHLLKCCSNGCGWTCQRPTHVFDGMPNAAEMPMLLERPHKDGVELTWPAQPTNGSGPILYLVSSRWNVGRHFSDADMTPWQVLTKTTMPYAIISDVKAGHWYQFRVAAVNIYGSRGWSAPSQPFTLSKEPTRPDPPSNITEGDTMIEDGRVAMTIHWSPPANSDLPVSRFKIYWSKRLKTVSPHLTTLQEMRKTVSGLRTSYQLTNLDPDTTYFIQVQAIAHFDDVRLKSEKAGIYIVTYPLPRASNRAVSLATMSVVTDSVYPPPVSPVDVAVEKIYFQNGLLRANISWRFDEVVNEAEECSKVLLYWSPEMCATESGVDEPLAPMMSASTHGHHFVVYDLRFGCRYLVRLQPVSSHRVTGDIAYVSLSTPYCWQADVVGDFTPDCPSNVARLPDEPPHLTHSLLVGSSDITVRLSWQVPRVPIADPPITGYRVVWAPVLPPINHLLMDQSLVESRELPKDVHSIVVSVDDDTSYAVFVCAKSRYGSGRVAALRFSTPPLISPSVTPPNPPYVDVGTPTRAGDSWRSASSATPRYIIIGLTPTTRRGSSNRSSGRQSGVRGPVVVAASPPPAYSSASRLTVSSMLTAYRLFSCLSFTVVLLGCCSARCIRTV